MVEKVEKPLKTIYKKLNIPLTGNNLRSIEFINSELVFLFDFGNGWEKYYITEKELIKELFPDEKPEIINVREFKPFFGEKVLIFTLIYREKVSA